MATNFTGDPTAVEAPASAPSLTAYPVSSCPDDGDALAAASVTQALHTPDNYIAYLQDVLRRMWFGDGSDGALTINDAATHYLTGIKQYTTLDIAIGSLSTDGWPVFCSTEFKLSTSSGGIWGVGGNASLATRGSYHLSSLGGPHASIAPSNGLPGSSTYPYTGQAHYGLGGNGGSGGGSGISGTTIANNGEYKIHPFRTVAGIGGLGTLFSGNANVYPGLRFDALRGGGAGGAGQGDGANAGGGGGAGAPLVVVCAPKITLALNSVILSTGGNGGAGSGGNANGGGGGGGGAFLFICQTFTDNGALPFVTGGTGGLGVGSGSPGSSGTAGNSTPYVVYVRA